VNTRYKFARWIKSIADKQMQDNYLKPNGGCDSCCPNCREWESQGNEIITNPLDDGSDERTCGKCNHKWLAIFTPAGFAFIRDVKD
jgi:hypothetical protein